jgi:hypothetical protein
MKLLFLLHPNVKSASNIVRALQYQDDPRIECIDLSRGYLSKSIVGIVKGGALYVFNMLTLCLFRRNNYAAIIIVKPWSFLIAIFLNFFFRKKIYLDINDPLHLPIFLGGWKFSLLLKVFGGGVIFESLEYKNYCEKKYGVEGLLLDDYSQWEDIEPISAFKKKMVIYWYGDPLLSHLLIEYVDFFKIFSEAGGVLKLSGADSEVLGELIESGVAVHVPDIKRREDFLSELAGSMFVFAPFDKDSLLHTLRGNLKAKIAMGAGCVVIAQDIAMHKRLIVHGENGWLFDDLNSLSFLIKSLANTQEIERMSKAARASIIKLGSRNFYIDRYMEIIA